MFWRAAVAVNLKINRNVISRSTSCSQDICSITQSSHYNTSTPPPSSPSQPQPTPAQPLLPPPPDVCFKPHTSKFCLGDLIVSAYAINNSADILIRFHLKKAAYWDRKLLFWLYNLFRFKAVSLMLNKKRIYKVEHESFLWFLPIFETHNMTILFLQLDNF